MGKYKQQVSLLLKVLPEIGKETCFAMHGGTAINLFVREMPRLSVDIDLTYIPLEDREQSLSNISEALNNIKSSIEALQQGIHVTHHKAELKLMDIPVVTGNHR